MFLTPLAELGYSLIKCVKLKTKKKRLDKKKLSTERQREYVSIHIHRINTDCHDLIATLL